MNKKRIPLWAQEQLSVDCEIDVEAVYCDCEALWLRGKACGYRYLRSSQTTDKIAVSVRHVIQKSLSEYYLLSAGENRRYQVHLYNQNGMVSQLTGRTCSPMLKHSAKVFWDEQILFLVGGSAVSKYELFQNCYYFSFSTNLWEEEKGEQEGLKVLMEDPSSLCYAVNGVMYLLSTRADLCYDQLHAVLLARPLKIAESRKLKQELRFKQPPKVATCEQSGDIYLYDLHYLYRQNSDLTFTRLNKGVFLSEPGQLVSMSCTPTELVVYSLQQNKQFCRHSIALEELQELAWSGDNIPLSFYFNKPPFSDLIFSIQDRQIQCSKQVFEFYSKKLRKLSTDQKDQKKTTIKLDMKFPTFYFLVQQIYGQFRTELKYDDETMFELLIFSSKFQIDEFQHKCEESIKLTTENFQQLYDFYRNVETVELGTRLFKHFVSNYKELAKVIPIGKVEEIVRCLYQPQCQHISVTELKALLGGDLRIRKKDKTRVVPRMAHLENLLEEQTLRLDVCEKCSQFLNASSLV